MWDLVEFKGFLFPSIRFILMSPGGGHSMEQMVGPTHGVIGAIGGNIIIKECFEQ